MTLTFFIHLPMKMERIRSSETSAIKTQTPGNYPKRNILQDILSFTRNELKYLYNKLRTHPPSRLPVHVEILQHKDRP